MAAGARRTSRREVSYGEQGLRLLPLTRIPKFGKALYWRLRGFSVSGTFLEVSEIQLFEGATQRNGTLSSSDTPTNASAIALLNDGSLSTRAYWTQAVATGANFWVKMTYTVPYAITGIKLGGFDTSNRYPTALQIQQSVDDTNWTTVGNLSGLTYPGNNTLSSLLTF